MSDSLVRSGLIKVIGEVFVCSFRNLPEAAAGFGDLFGS